MSLPVAEGGFNRIGNGDPLRLGELLADLIFRVLAGQDVRYPYDARSDRGPLQDVADGEQAAFAEHQEVLFCNANGLKKPLAGDAGGEGPQISMIFPEALPDENCLAGDGDDLKRMAPH